MLGATALREDNHDKGTRRQSRRCHRRQQRYGPRHRPCVLLLKVAHVVINRRRQEQIDMALKEIGSSKAIGVQGDVANMKDLDPSLCNRKRKIRHIDILFANAGLANLAPIGDVTEESFDLLINVNVKGLLFSVQKALPLMKDGSSIILMLPLLDRQATPAFGVYAGNEGRRTGPSPAQLDLRSEGPQNPRQHIEPRPYRKRRFSARSASANNRRRSWCQYRAERTDGPHWNPRGNLLLPCSSWPQTKSSYILRHRAGSRWRYGASLKQAERSFYENYLIGANGTIGRTGFKRHWRVLAMR